MPVFSAIPFCMWRLSDESLYVSLYCASAFFLPKLIFLKVDLLLVETTELEQLTSLYYIYN